jgi:hypothetical protein
MSARRILILVAALTLALVAPADAAQVQKIAGGLDNPRHLAFGDHGLYVAEAGRGGPGPCFPGAEGGQVCVGATGAVTVIHRDGDQVRLVEGLASLADQGTGASAIGPHGIYVTDEGRVLVTNGGPTEANRDELRAGNPAADLFGRVLRVEHDGDIDRLADIWGFERDNNPDAEVANPAVDSNAVDVLADGRHLIVADAGGNSLLKVKHGDIEVLSVFANRLFPNPFGPGEVPTQTVPTGVVKGPDGDYYMSQLTGFPFPVGGANVYRVDRRSGDAEVFASGFTNIMDLAFDEHGTLWVLEIDHDSLLPPVGPSTDGAIFSVDRHGVKTQLELAPGTLTEPGGITVGADGALYVTNKARAAGGGEVLRIAVDGGDDGEHGHGHRHGRHGKHHGKHGHGHSHGHDHGHGGKHRGKHGHRHH